MKELIVGMLQVWGPTLGVLVGFICLAILLAQAMMHSQSRDKE